MMHDVTPECSQDSLEIQFLLVGSTCKAKGEKSCPQLLNLIFHIPQFRIFDSISGINMPRP